MVGISLTPEQIRAAPPEVRRWLEHEIATSLGFPTAPEPAAAPSKHLVACSAAEANAIYGAIRGMLPVVNVFFELGREGQSLNQNGIEAHQLADMLRHTRLQSLEQIAACLQVIDDAVRQIRRDATATICAFDRRGYCLIATETQRSIAGVWRQLLAGRDLDASAPGDASEAPPPGAGAGFPGLAEKQAAPVRFDPSQGLSPGAGADPVEGGPAPNVLP